MKTDRRPRRRGAELENALLDATWEEIVERGYAAMTIESVAERAGTSRPVIYRRWPTKADLARATLERTMTRDPMELPDTGSLRGDLLAIMHYANERRIGTTALLASYLGAYFQETGTSPAELRESVLGDRVSPIDAALDRAVARGEVDPARLTPRVRTRGLRPVPPRGVDDPQAGAGPGGRGDPGRGVPPPREQVGGDLKGVLRVTRAQNSKDGIAAVAEGTDQAQIGLPSSLETPEHELWIVTRGCRSCPLT